MQRRDFTVGLAQIVATAAVTRGAQAQQRARPVIGLLDWAAPRWGAEFLKAFHSGLAETGFDDGVNVTIEYRSADQVSARLPDLAADLVRLPVTVIVAIGSTRSERAAKAATSTIPIVFATSGDPVKDGLVESLGRPGGNMTGVVDLATSLGGKRLSLLRDLVPGSKTFGFLAGGVAFDTYEDQKSEILAAARTLGCEVIIQDAPREADYERAFINLLKRKVEGLVVGAFNFQNGGRIKSLATFYKLPAIYPFRAYADTGGLISYSANGSELLRQVGIYTGSILKGVKPADLPVVLPKKFDLVLNLKTAKALGIEIPSIIAALADTVIE